MHLDVRRLARAHDLVLLQVGVQHEAIIPIKHSILVQGVGNALKNAAIDLAFKQQWIHGPPAVMHGPHLLDFDYASFSIHGNLDELHTTVSDTPRLFPFTLASALV